MCPPGDLTEWRNQLWAMIAPLREQIHDLSADDSKHTGSGKSREQAELAPIHMCRDGISFNALQRLFAPVLSSSRVPDRHASESSSPLWDSNVLTRAPCSSPSALESLPAEITRSVMQLLCPADTVALGLCSQRLWARAVAHTHETYRRDKDILAPWVGTPLACIGTYLTELPPALALVMPELDSQGKGWSRSKNSASAWSMSRIMCPERRWLAQARKNYADVKSLPDVEKQCLGVFVPENEIITGSGVPRELWPSMRACLRRGWSLGVHAGGAVYLRNLTTKEFVRLDLCPGEDSVRDADSATVAGASWLSLDVLLMMKITWTGLPGLRYTQRGNARPFWDAMRQGPWAGHCFDVVGAEPSIDDESGTKWLDITETVASDAGTWMAESQRFLYKRVHASDESARPRKRHRSSRPVPSQPVSWGPVLTSNTYPDSYRPNQ